MPLIEKIAEIYDRFKEEGLVWFVSRSSKVLRESISSPWVYLYWLPLAEAVDLRTSNAKQAGSDKFQGLLSRLLKGVELRVATSLSDLKPQEYQALKDSVGGSDIPFSPTGDYSMLGGHAVAQCLRNEGVKHVFSVPGESYIAVITVNIIA